MKLPSWTLFGLISPREARGALGLALIGVSTLAWMPGSIAGPSWFGWDKLDHMIAFAALTVLARCGWPQLNRAILPAMLLGYGVLIELVQNTPWVGRGFSLADIIADVIGIALGLGLARLGAVVLDRTPWIVRQPEA